MGPGFHPQPRKNQNQISEPWGSEGASEFCVFWAAWNEGPVAGTVEKQLGGAGLAGLGKLGKVGGVSCFIFPVSSPLCHFGVVSPLQIAPL